MAGPMTSVVRLKMSKIVVPVPINAGPATSPIAVNNNPILAKAKAPKMKEKRPRTTSPVAPLPMTKAKTTYNAAIDNDKPNKPMRRFEFKYLSLIKPNNGLPTTPPALNRAK